MVQVSSPLTQLTLHPSPQHPSHLASLAQPFSVVKEEVQSSCSLSRSTSGPLQSKESLCGDPMDTSSMDKDQMLQEKDKRIEELTRMLRQKQQLVETLRSQLEQGKVAAVKKEGKETSTPSLEVQLQPLIKASDIQPPMLTNGMVLTVKEEVEPKNEVEDVTKEPGGKLAGQPMQCSQETLLRLQQIHRLQLQAEHHKQQQQQQRSPEAKVSSPQRQQEQKKKEAQLLVQQQQLQQLIIQQTQQKLSQHKRLQLLKQGQQEARAQQKNQLLLKQAQNHKATLSHVQQRKQQRSQQRQKQAAAASSQPVTPFTNLSHAA